MSKLEKHSQAMAKLKSLITREKNCAVVIDRAQTQWTANLDAATARTNEDFYVVVMGNFNAGKSTMINALIGEKVLPSYKLPTTAVMTELRYGDEKKIIMYPKTGQMVEGHGDQPFQVPATADAVERYITIDNDAGINCKPEDSVEIASQFEKMELYWPLPMLKNGVVLVDSPGLNDPYSNDVIVRQYLPRADAIIYILKGDTPYQGTDKKELDSVNEYGIKNIIFACTYWDQMREDGEAAVEKQKKYCLSCAMKHTDLGEKSVHFLASRDGLHARTTGNSDLWVESGFAEFESYLQDYLTRHRGQDKVNNIVSTMESQASAMKRHAQILNENAQKDKTIIRQKVDNASLNLDGLKKDGNRILTTFKLTLDTRKPDIKTSVRDGLRSLKEKVDLEGFEPETKFRTGLGKLNPFGKKALAEKVAGEFQDEYRARLQKELLKYQSTKVSPLMQDAMKYAVSSVENDIKSLSAKLDALDVSVGLPSVETEHSGQGGNLLLGIAIGLLTGDWFTGGSIALYGGAGRQIGLQVGTAAGLGLAIALGAPITLPVAALALIAANIVAIFMDNNERRMRRIREETLTQLKKAYFEDGDDKFIEPSTNAIMERVDQVFDKACDDMKFAIEATFAEKKEMFNAMIEQANMEGKDQEKAVSARKDAIKDLDALILEAVQVRKEY